MEQVSENEVENQPYNDAGSPSNSVEKSEVIEAIKTEVESLPAEFPAGIYPETQPILPPQKEELVQAPEWCVIQAGESIPLKGYNFKLVGYAKGTFDLILRCVGPTGKTLKERAELAKKNAKRR